jgi:WD40 repeat protein
MHRNKLLLIVLISLLSGCASLMQAEPPERILAGAHAFGTTTLAYTLDGQRLISGGFRGELRIWDASTLRPLGDAHGHHAAVRAILPLESGDFVSGGDDGRLILWHNNRIKALATGADVTALVLFQHEIVSAHDDGSLRVWSADSLKLLRTLPLDGKIVAISAHGARLAIALARTIVLLDPDYATRLTLTAAHPSRDLQFSPDGRMLAAGGWFRLNLWDVYSGTFRSIPTEHNGLVASIAFSPDGRHLATLGRHTDSALRVLDTKDFKVVRRYQAHELCGSAVRFSPDGRTLASASDDESVRLYRLDPVPYSNRGEAPSPH